VLCMSIEPGYSGQEFMPEALERIRTVRGLPKGKETWDEWRKELAPSADLLAAFHGKRGPPLSWPDYRKRYLAEMREQTASIDDLAGRVKGGEAITLLCSAACTDPEHCHRTLLRRLIETRMR
jgi:uncharacterized protein YeaO (DUF488 family)